MKKKKVKDLNLTIKEIIRMMEGEIIIKEGVLIAANRDEPQKPKTSVVKLNI